MEDRLIEQLKNAKQHVHLSAERKEALRTELLAMVDGRVRAADALRHPTRGRSASLATFFTNRMRAITAVVAVLVMGSAGVSVAAEQARPGDTLYPVKVGVNENIRASLAFSAEAKAEIAVERAERRLAEAAELSAEGRLDAEVEAGLRADFEKRSEEAEKHIRKLQADGEVEGAAHVAGRFEGILRARQAILASLEGSNDVTAGAAAAVSGSATATVQSDNSGHGRALGESVRGRLNALTNLRALLEAGVSAGRGNGDADAEDADNENKDEDAGASVRGAAGAEASARAHVKAATGVAERAHQYVHDKIEGAEADAEAETRADLAVRLAADAEAKLAAGAYGEAFALANAAIRAAAEARVLVNTESRIDGDVHLDDGDGSDPHSNDNDKDKDEDDDRGSSGSGSGSVNGNVNGALNGTLGL